MTTEVDNSIDSLRTTVVPRVLRDECSIGAFVRRTYVTYCLSSRDCNCNEALATKRHHYISGPVQHVSGVRNRRALEHYGRKRDRGFGSSWLWLCHLAGACLHVRLSYKS